MSHQKVKTRKTNPLHALTDSKTCLINNPP